jgi:hypothetical protein
MRSFPFTLVLAVASCGASSDPDSKVPTTLDESKNDQVQKVPTTFEEPIQKVPTTLDEPKNDQIQKVPATSGPNPKVPATSGPTFGCGLTAPVSSDDACSKDADCAPSTPCHARACVAASKATPRTPDTVCTMNIDCQSADVNPCSCYEGRCALVPKNR